ncbi:MAG: hypothetical protein WBB29_13985 [Geitlerinemataceae cyanobacterium]
MVQSPPPNFNDDRHREQLQQLTPPQQRQLQRLQNFVEPTPKIEPRIVASQPSPPPKWLPYALVGFLLVLGVALGIGGTIAYTSLVDPNSVKIETPQTETKFSRWTVVTIVLSCTVGSILIARQLERDRSL